MDSSRTGMTPQLPMPLVVSMPTAASACPAPTISRVTTPRPSPNADRLEPADSERVASVISRISPRNQTSRQVAPGALIASNSSDRAKSANETIRSMGDMVMDTTPNHGG